MNSTEKHQHVLNWLSSGQSQRQYCNTHNLKYTTFTYWIRLYRQGQLQPDKNNSFVEVVKSVPGHDKIEIYFLSGIKMFVPSDTPVSVIKDLIRQ